MRQKRTLARIIMVLFAVGVVVAIGSQITTASREAEPAMVPASFTELAESARPGVVNIRTVKTIKGGSRVFRHFFGNPFGDKGPFGDENPLKNFFGPFSGGDYSPDFKQQSLGSGFIIDREGYIVTNNHVIENADQIKVKLANGKEFDATVVGRDPKTDVALIKIQPSSPLVPLEMGDSDKLRVGRWVVAIGSPFGLEQTVTAGIVSAKGRTIGAGPYDDFIQTDASINPGNSGGPLLNMQGQVVGINTAIVAQGQGIGFAIPINLAEGIITQLKNGGEVTRGWLGVAIQDLTPELAGYYGANDKKGVLVTQVYKGDPADEGGIKPKDIIIAVDGKSVSSSRELSRTIASTPVGKRTGISILRDGVEKTVYVKLAKQGGSDPRAKREVEQGDELGLTLATLRPETAHRFGYDENEKGLLVTEIEADSKGQRAGIQRGDLLKEINHVPLTKLKDYRTEMEKIKDGETAQLLIKRGKAGFVLLKITV